jgi:cytochrome b
MTTDPASTPVKQRVWDLPVRLFHWLLVVLIPFSWWTARNGEIDLHIWSGCGVLTLLLFRILWGFVGSSTARFSSFVRGPRAVLGYARDTRAWKAIGHNPMGALSVLALLAVLIAQVSLGLINSDEDGIVQGPLARHVDLSTTEWAHEWHDILFDVLVVLIALHIAAILFYRLAGKKLTGAMITGRGEIDPDVEPMQPGKWWAAALCLAAAVGVTRWVIAGAPPFGT